MIRKLENGFSQGAAHRNMDNAPLQSRRRTLTAQRFALSAAVSLFTCFGTTGASMAGYGFSEQGNALTKALNEQLIFQGFCKDFQTCQAALQMYREDDQDHIYLNMYMQKDMALAAAVSAFLVARGLNITSGMAITLHVYSGPHEQYRGLNRIFGEGKQSIKLEVTK